MTRGTTSPRPEAASLVCLVDDDSSVREALSILFRSVGLQVKLFGSAPEQFQSKLPDVAICLVLDIRMPGLSGLDFQDRLSKTNIHMPIIFMTGHGDIPMSMRALKAGAVDFLTKPFRDQDMLDVVAAALERDRRRRQSEGAVSDLRALFASLTARARGHDSGYGRIHEQSDRRPDRRQRDYGEDTPRAHYEENGCEVAGRSGENGRNARNSSREVLARTNLSMIFRSCVAAHSAVRRLCYGRLSVPP